RMVLGGVLEATLAVATLSLRLMTILFTRFHPLGKRYLNRIYGSCALYTIALLIRCLLPNSRRASRRHHPWLLLLLGWVDRSSPSHDLSFSRLGYVDESTARIVIRAPVLSTNYVKISWAPSNEDGQATMSQTTVITDPNDHTGTFLLDGLEPDTPYTYTTNASHAGSFRTAALSPKQWSLISTSCIKPFYPYSPLDHGLRIKGLEYLDQHVSANQPDMMLFLGDFIYIDLPVALGWSPEHYTTAYRQVYASPSWSPALRSTPWLHVYDDHEIINDWAANETGLYQSAMRPYWSYQGHANPPSQYGVGKTHYTFRRGDVSFFVLDTRRYRSAENMADGPAKTMLGAAQLDDLREWLETEKSWKVVVSSVPFTRNWRGPDSADSWSGYLWERDMILEMMRQTDGVIILSGDRHEHATTIFPPASDKGGKSVIEFSTSPLNQFYEPFDRFHRQIEDTDISVYSHPWGNSKFGRVTFDTSEEGRWTVDYELIVDGHQVWNYTWEFTK
ncbi:PhoD-like phosphatase-domain-containing protein, partial [Colletotrichum phormii]